MGIFSVKCPQCGVMLEADEKYIGARAACAECDFHFILQKIDEEVVPVIELHPTKSAGSEIREEQKKQAQSSTEFKEFSFINPPSKLTFAKPVSLIVPSGIIEVNCWNDILCACFNYALTHENAAVLRTFLDKENNLFSKRMILSSSAANLRRARELSENVFLETNLSASHIIQIVCGLMKNCGFPAEQFFIRYIPHGTNVSDLKNEEYSIDNQPETEVSEPTTKKIVATSPIEVFQFYPNVLQALKNQNVSLVKDLLVVPGSRFSCERNIGSSKVKAMRALVNALRPYLQGSDTEVIPLELLPIAPTLSALGKENWEEMCSPDQGITDTEKIDAPDATATAVFQKKIDWSLLTDGTTIPIAYHDFFLDNLSCIPRRGTSQSVSIVFKGIKYFAKVYRGPRRTKQMPVLQLRWSSRNSGIAKVLQTTFSQIYSQLSVDRKNKNGLDHVFKFFQGKTLDEFILTIDKEIIETLEPDKTCVQNSVIQNSVSKESISLPQKTFTVFQKKIDWSLLTDGTTIPVAYHDFFLDNLSCIPRRGTSQPVSVVFNRIKYSAKVYRGPHRHKQTPALQLRWSSRNSGIAKVLQTTFSQIYSQLAINRKNKSGLDYVFKFSQGKMLDEFILAIDKEVIETLEPEETCVQNSVIQNSVSDESVSNTQKTFTVFQKKIDWSLLTDGTTIPIAYHDFFLDNLSHIPLPGTNLPVSVVIEGIKYSAKVYRGPCRSKQKPVLQLRWSSRNSGIAKVLQTTFSQIYVQLSMDRKNKEGSDHIFTFSQGEQKDEFILSLDKPLIEVTENNEQAQASPKTSVQAIDVEELKNIICRDFNNGFVFNAGTIKLLENVLGRDCSEAEQRELKRVMFKRSDDIYLLPEMVADDETVADMTARIKEYFAEYGCFSLSVLFDEFGYVLKNLTNPDSDFRLFLLKTILPDDGKIFGRLQRQICISGNISEEEVTQTLAERIREMLQGYGDAVCIDDLDNELPYLNKPALEMILQEHIADAIEIKVDGLGYWKLVEFFCLPDDFAEYLQLTVSSMEEAQTAPSLQTLSEAMEQQYGEGFREIYAVDDDDVFKQIIKVCIADDQYSWNRNVFAKQNAGQELNVADEFLQTQQGIFHESEFFDYASTHRGLTNRTTLICGYLRPRCIRLDQFHWISLENFDTQSDYSNEIADKISEILNGILGARTFLPIGTLPEALLSSLPVISINGRTFYWNHYMLASIAAHKTNELRIVNDEPSPYTVTAMLIPLAAQYNDDIVDYIFNDMRHSGNILGTADEVFEFLKSHQIRMTKTQKLMERIKDFWSFE